MNQSYFPSKVLYKGSIQRHFTVLNSHVRIHFLMYLLKDLQRNTSVIITLIIRFYIIDKKIPPLILLNIFSKHLQRMISFSCNQNVAFIFKKFTKICSFGRVSLFRSLFQLLGTALRQSLLGPAPRQSLLCPALRQPLLCLSL